MPRHLRGGARRYAVESLEERIQLASVTVITHGFETGAAPSIQWMDAMAGAVAVKEGGANIYKLTIGVGGANSLGGPFVTGASTGNSVLEVNWSAVANELDPDGGYGVSADQIAGSIFPFLTRALDLPNDLVTSRPFDELPIHLIGHSRGASVMSTLAGLLGKLGIWVDQLTTLDPHPLTSLGDPQLTDVDPIDYPVPTTDPAVQVPSNVVFADNYYQTINYPGGTSIDGADNTPLSQQFQSDALADGLGVSALGLTLTVPVQSDHSYVHSYYYGTIARGATDDGDGTQIQVPIWYDAQARATTGYDWSRTDGAARPNDGVGPLGGGSASRVAVQVAGGSVFANVGNLQIAGRAVRRHQ